MFSNVYPKRVVLASPHGAIAHAVRCFSIGSHFHRAGFELFVIGHKDSTLLSWGKSVYRDIPIKSYEILTTAGSANILKSKLNFYSREHPFKEFTELERMLTLIQPSLVLSDAYPLIPLVSEKLRIPHVGLASAAWTSYYLPNRPPLRLDWLWQIVNIPRLKQVMRQLASSYFNRKLAYWANPLNHIATSFGLRRRPNVLNYLEGNDLTLITDIPEFGPLRNPPCHMKYCGPISWHPTFDSGELVDALKERRKTIYVSFGSSGDFSLLPELLKWLLEMEFRVVMTSNGICALPRELVNNKNLLTADLINGFQVIPLCDAVIFHGGIGTVYQVLASGKPSIVIPVHVEQFWNGHRLEEMGLGHVLHRRLVCKSRLTALLGEIIDNDNMRQHIREISGKIVNGDPARKAYELIMETVL
jgi:UDP:flavonoid glycosyltransferase YjiC (YdhE family)